MVFHPKNEGVQKYQFAKPYITEAEKKHSQVKAHYCEKGGRNCGSATYQGGKGYNQELYEDAMARTIAFFNKYKK